MSIIGSGGGGIGAPGFMRRCHRDRDKACMDSVMDTLLRTPLLEMWPVYKMYVKMTLKSGHIYDCKNGHVMIESKGVYALMTEQLE